MRSNRIRTITLTAAVGLAALLFSTGASQTVRAYGAETKSNGNNTARAAFASVSAPERSTKAIAFRNDMRQLWEDHVIWTRMVIVSVAADLPDLKMATNRLLQNQVDLGNAIKPYYGDAAGGKLTALLQQHIKTAAELLTAAKAGDEARTNDAKARWYANGDEIAQFLSSANPQNWPLDTIKSWMKTHLDTTLNEAVARLHGDWAADIAAFDKVQKHILRMADALSIGIIRQFPAEFAEIGDDRSVSSVQVSMVDTEFKPKEVTAAPGTGIKWTNNDTRPHTVTADTANAVSGGPDSGAQFPNGIQPGQSFTWTVPAHASPGARWYYHCAFHGSQGDGSRLGAGMSGVITVR